MGSTACKIIIIEGNLAYAVTEAIADKYHQVNTLLLEAAIRASCDGVHQASIYSAIKNYGVPQDPTLEKIINLHGRIVSELPLVARDEAQELVDTLTEALFTATRELYINENFAFTPISIGDVRASLKIP